MMKVQKYLVEKTKALRSTELALDALTEEFGIKTKRYPAEGLVLLDYDQINSPKMHELTIECRSLILTIDTFQVVSRSFDRFFNLGECPEYYSDFSFDTASIFEKADGSLIKVYFYDSKWNISTRGTAFAEGPHTMGGTFRSKVIEAFGVDENGFQQFFDNNCWAGSTYIFEYCSPENRIVTQYEKAEMVLLGVRTTVGDYGDYGDDELCEHIAELAKINGLNVRLPKQYNAGSLEELVLAAKELPNLEEGYIVWDKVSNKRVKIKSPTYLVAHKMRGENGLTPKNIFTLMFDGEVDEYLAYFPNDEEFFIAAQVKIDSFINDIMNVWYNVRMIETQKEFALAVKEQFASGVLFEARKRNITPKEAFYSLELNKKLRLFGI